MSTYEMSQKELNKISSLTRLKNWEISQKETALELGVTTRQVRRIMKKFLLLWERSLSHKLRWRKANHHADSDKIAEIVSEQRFAGCKPTFMTEKLHEYYNITVCKETVRKIMIDAWKRSSRSRKEVKQRLFRIRKEAYWEMVQFDWSYHLRFENRNTEYCLLVAIDDATGKVFAQLYDNEWYNAVSDFRIKYIILYWIPKSLYLDKFSTYKINHPKATNEKDLITSFNRAMQLLWSMLIFANSPQAKWRVEKLNDTFQDRLVWELRLNNINTAEEANIFLIDIFLPAYNTQFNVVARSNCNCHRELTKTEISTLERVFAKQETRVINWDRTIQYKNRFFQIYKSKDKSYCVYPRKEIYILQNNSWELRIITWKQNKVNWESVMIDVNWEELDAWIVKVNRAIKRSTRYRTEQVTMKINKERRDKERFEQSKQKQYEFKAKKLLEKYSLFPDSTMWEK